MNRDDSVDLTELVKSSLKDVALHDDFELSFGADLLNVPIVRSLAATMATRADFDLDAVADLRLAVDEACATLVSMAIPGTLMSCRLTVTDKELSFICTTVSRAEFVPDMGSFGWRVLTTLADSVRGWSSVENNQCLSRIEVIKKRGRESRD